MKNILIVNGHQPHPDSLGRLNASFIERARVFFDGQDMEVRETAAAGGWEVDVEVDSHLWADAVLFQFPLYSMGVPWSLKRYLDEVYTAGMDGRMAKGDGRTRSDASRQYGSGGMLTGLNYMLSMTLNAPAEAFGNPEQTFFGGMSLDGLLAPVHLNFRFFGMTALPSFAAYDVAKAPRIEDDFARFENHLETVFGGPSS